MISFIANKIGKHSSYFYRNITPGKGGFLRHSYGRGLNDAKLRNKNLKEILPRASIHSDVSFRITNALKTLLLPDYMTPSINYRDLILMGVNFDDFIVTVLKNYNYSESTRTN